MNERIVGVEVQAIHHDVRFHAFGDPRASDDQRHAGAAFHGGDLAAIERIVVGDDLAGMFLHTAVI